MISNTLYLTQFIRQVCLRLRRPRRSGSYSEDLADDTCPVLGEAREKDFSTAGDVRACQPDYFTQDLTCKFPRPGATKE